MEGKGRSRGRRGSREARRRISALLSVALTTAMTLNAPLGALGFGVMEAFASSSNARPATGSNAGGSSTSAPDSGSGEGWMTAKNAEYVQGQAQDVDIYVIAEDNDVAPGNVSTMRLYLKNNTGSVLTNGTLSFTGSRIKKEDGTFVDISGTGVSAPDASIDDWGAAADMDEEGLDELEALEAEAYAREFGKDEEGQGSNKLTGLSLEPGQLHEIEFEFYTDDSVRDGKAYVDFKFQGESGEGKIRSSEKFYYSIGLPSVNIELLDGQALETGVQHELSIWMTAPSWGDYEIEDVQIPVKKIETTTAAETAAEAGSEAVREETATGEAETEGTKSQEAGTDGVEAEDTGMAETEAEGAGAQDAPTADTEAEDAKETEAPTEEDTQAVEIIEDEPVPVIDIDGQADGLTLGRSDKEAETVYAPLMRTADTSILEAETAETEPETAAEEPDEETAAETVPEEPEEEEQDTAAPADETSPAETEPAAPVVPAGQETEETAPAVQESTTGTEDTTAAESTDPVQDPAAESSTAATPTEESTVPIESTEDEAAKKASEEAAAREAEQAAQKAQALAIKESKVSYTVEVFGTEFKKFRPKKTAEVEDIGWISCLYELAEDARPGVYYGKVTAKGKWNKRGFTTSQGFLFEITGEGTITLKGRLDGTEVEVAGPASSFPDAAKLELEVKALSQEEEEAVREAIGRKDAPYAVFEMSLLADGETADTKGPVTVKVGNKSIKENTAKIAEAAKVQAAAAEIAEEQTMTAQAAGEQNAALSDGAGEDNAIEAAAIDQETEKAAPVNRKKGPGAEGKSDTGASLTAAGTLASTAKEKAEKEPQDPVVADSQAAGLALMKIDTRSVQAEELKSGITEGGELQTATSEVMAIYAVTGLEEEMAHPAFEEAVTLKDGVTVTVRAEEGVLPEGVELSVEEVTEKVESALTEKLIEEGGMMNPSVLAYDVNLMMDGKKLSNDYWKDDHVVVNFSGEKIEQLSKDADTVKIMTLETPTVEVEAALGDKEEMPMLEDVTAEDIGWKEDEVKTVDVSGDDGVKELEYQAEHFTLTVVAADDSNVITLGPDTKLQVAVDGEITVRYPGVVYWECVGYHPENFESIDNAGSADVTPAIDSETTTIKGVKNGLAYLVGIVGEKRVFWELQIGNGAGETTYFYILKPGYKMEEVVGDTENYPSRWYFAGIGSVKNPNEGFSEGNVTAPVDGETVTFQCEGGDGHICNKKGQDLTYEVYPKIKFDDVYYTYSAEPNAGGNTYNVIWENMPLSNGANVNLDPDGTTDNHFIVKSTTTKDCLHINGIAVLSNHITAIFKVQDPVTGEFEILDKYTQVLSAGDTAKRPEYYEDKFLETITDGTDTYYFEDQWYREEEFASAYSGGFNEATLRGLAVDGVVTFYGRYLLEQPDPKYELMVHKTLSDLNDEAAELYISKVQEVQFKLVTIDGSGNGTEEQSYNPDKKGNISFRLAPGKYRLYETSSAGGYQCLIGEQYIEFEIVSGIDGGLKISYGEKGKDEYWELDEKTNAISVTNKPEQQPGILLPDTGGPGLLQMNRFGWLLLLIALMMAGTEVRYFGVHRNRVKTEETWHYEEL